MKKIVIIGTSGCGKTSLAINLSQKTSINCYDLDDYLWLPNWQKRSSKDFEQDIINITNQDKWIISGNSSFLRKNVWHKADLIIWLDYSLITCLWRALKRSIDRIINHLPCCNNNFETFKLTFMSKKSIVVWIFFTYFKRKKEYGFYYKNSFNYPILLRFKNSTETQNWLSQFVIIKKL